MGVPLFFLFGEGKGVGDSSSRAREGFLAGVAVGVGDFFFVAAEVFFFRGVGVGVEKIFLSAFPKVSAGLATSTGEAITARTIRIRRSM